jgi:hypothetical protein
MSRIQFLNIDLDLESDEDISDLVTEIGTKLIVMRDHTVSGVHHASFETTLPTENEIIAEYSSVILRLTETSKRLWERCSKRCFDFGYDCGDAPNDFRSIISAESVSKIKEMGAEMAITIYPIAHEDT